MTRAMLEGICGVLRLRKETIERNSKQAIRCVNAVGGGSLSPHWMQMLAAALDVEVRVPENTRCAGAIGAAYCALIGLGLCRDFNDCAARVRIQSTYMPNRNTQQAYQEQWERFVEMAGVPETFRSRR